MVGSIYLQVVSSVIMDHVTIGDGCSILGSVICSNVQLQERVVLKDCQVSISHTLTITHVRCICLFSQYNSARCHFRLKQASWSLLEVNIKQSLWQSKKSYEYGSLPNSFSFFRARPFEIYILAVSSFISFVPLFRLLG